MTLKNKTTVEDYYRTRVSPMIDHSFGPARTAYRSNMVATTLELRRHDGEIYEYESPQDSGLCVVDTAGTIVYTYSIIKK